MIEHFKIKQTLKLWNEFKYYADYWNRVSVRNNPEGAFKLLRSVTYLRVFLNYMCVFGSKSVNKAFISNAVELYVDSDNRFVKAKR